MARAKQASKKKTFETSLAGVGGRWDVSGDGERRICRRCER